jgi:hypothetical protein
LSKPEPLSHYFRSQNFHTTPKLVRMRQGICTMRFRASQVIYHLECVMKRLPMMLASSLLLGLSAMPAMARIKPQPTMCFVQLRGIGFRDLSQFCGMSAKTGLRMIPSVPTAPQSIPRAVPQQAPQQVPQQPTQALNRASRSTIQITPPQNPKTIRREIITR